MEKTFNVGNYYTDERFQKLKEELEQGHTVRVYVDCIGHTRTEMVESEFREALQKEFKDRLIITRDYADKYKLV